MNTKFYFAALAVAAMTVTSCSSDETVDIQKGTEISFNVTAGKASRVGGTATTTSSISAFRTYATASNKKDAYLIDGVTLSKGAQTSDPWSFDDNVNRYWPTNATVDFWSYSPATPQSGTVNHADGAALSIAGYTANGAEDLLYAYNKECNRNTGSGIVPVNFRHALSQIVFKARNLNKDLKVEITDVVVSNVATTGDLTWATETTAAHLASNTGADTEQEGTWGTWTVAEALGSYDADVKAVTLEGKKETAVDLTTNAGGSALFLMPQTLNPWAPTTPAGNGSKLLVKCKVTDIKSGVQIWPANNAEAADVAISLKAGDENKWKQGKIYVYTLSFGDGAGFVPDSGDPVLALIKLSVTVDEFQNGSEWDVPMNEK